MASTTRVTRGTAQSGTATLTSTVLITRGTAQSANGSRVRITRGRAASGATSLSTARITRGAATSSIPGALGARAGADQSVESFRDIPLDGSRSTGTWASAAWRQTGDSRQGPSFNPASPTVQILGSGTQVTYRAPADHQTYTVTFELAVTGATSTSVDTRTDTVLPWLRWALTDTGLVPAGHSVLV